MEQYTKKYVWAFIHGFLMFSTSWTVIGLFVFGYLGWKRLMEGRELDPRIPEECVKPWWIEPIWKAPSIRREQKRAIAEHRSSD